MRAFSLWWMLSVVAGCTSATVPGADGVDGAPGMNGLDGQNGVSCWDLDADGAADAGEDVNGDGAVSVLDCRGAEGPQGPAGTEGAPGSEGPPGVSCWDTDADGFQDLAEDVNADNVWDALDCRGESSAGGLSKLMLYSVVGVSGSTSTAACADADDVLLHGGCAFSENCIPHHPTSIPQNVADPGATASWYCALNCGSVVAHATCLTVP